MFFKGSRYEKVPDDQISAASGREIRFKRVRFIPETKALVRHTVEQGERLDTVAHRSYNNAELFWRIADANRAMKPEELMEEPGRAIAIPGSEG